MDDAQQYTPAQAADPATPGEVLAAIAGSRPDLRPYVAANPAAYPGLLDWLAQLGDPAVDSSLRARGLEDAMSRGQDEDVTSGPETAESPLVGERERDDDGDAAAGRHADPGRGVDEEPRAEGGDAPTAYQAPTAYVPPAASVTGVGGAPQADAHGGDTRQDGHGVSSEEGAHQAGPGPYAGPYGAPGAGPYGPPGGPPPKKNRTWLWVLLGVLAVLLVGGILLVVFLVQGINRAVDDAGGLFDPGEAQSYGEDATLDALWDRCEDGDMVACDDLFRESPVDSEYEEFGDTCGGRTEGGSWCEDLAEEGANAPQEGTDEGVIALAAA